MGEMDLRARIDRAFQAYPGEKRGLARRVADRCDVSEQAVGRWRQTGKVSRENLAPLAEALGVSLEWLLTGRGDMRRGPVRQVISVSVVGDTANGVQLDRLGLAPGEGDAIVQVVDTERQLYAVRIIDRPELDPRYLEGEVIVVCEDCALQAGHDVFVQRLVGEGKVDASVYRLAWVTVDELALDPVVPGRGAGREIVLRDDLLACHQVIDHLPPFAVRPFRAE